MNEFLTSSAAEDDQALLGNCLRTQAEALWSLGERARAEKQYETLIGRLPSFAGGYIGLADCYWLGPEPTPEPKEYARRKRSISARWQAPWGQVRLGPGRDLEQCLRH